MWLLHLLPSSFILLIVYCLLIGGAIGIIAGFFLGRIPFVKQYQLVIQIISIILFCTGVYWYGGYTTEMLWRAEVERVKAEVDRTEKQAKVITKTIVKEGKERIVVVQRQVDVIKKEIEIQKEIIDAECTLNSTAVELYNKGMIPPKQQPQEETK